MFHPALPWSCLKIWLAWATSISLEFCTKHHQLLEISLQFTKTTLAFETFWCINSVSQISFLVYAGGFLDKDPDCTPPLSTRQGQHQQQQGQWVPLVAHQRPRSQTMTPWPFGLSITEVQRKVAEEYAHWSQSFCRGPQGQALGTLRTLFWCASTRAQQQTLHPSSMVHPPYKEGPGHYPQRGTLHERVWSDIVPTPYN